jgi:hypothetical protein
MSISANHSLGQSTPPSGLQFIKSMTEKVFVELLCTPGTGDVNIFQASPDTSPA